MILSLKNQVTNLELSKRIKELGFPQDSLFYWLGQGWELVRSAEEAKGFEGNVSAYTVAELGELLPDWVYSQRIDGGRGWVCDGDNSHGNPNPYIECWLNNTEADVRAKMLIYLCENGLMEVVK